MLIDLCVYRTDIGSTESLKLTLIWIKHILSFYCKTVYGQRGVAGCAPVMLSAGLWRWLAFLWLRVGGCSYAYAYVCLSAMGGGFGGLGCYLSDRLLLSFFFL